MPQTFAIPSPCIRTLHLRPKQQLDEQMCINCGGKLTEKKQKYFCQSCGTLCQTCCDGGAN